VRPLTEDTIAMEAEGGGEAGEAKEEAKAGSSDRWRWVVLVAGWLSFGLFSGTLYTSGLFYVVYLEEFRGSRSSTAWVGSLCSAVYLMYGPAVAWALGRFGAAPPPLIRGLWPGKFTPYLL
jgi:hypothetical protein